MTRQLRRAKALRRLDIIAERRDQARQRRLEDPPLPDHVDPFVDQAAAKDPPQPEGGD